jgi:methylmalonyl-CoA/ethylmalonyl-CoA epimerase
VISIHHIGYVVPDIDLFAQAMPGAALELDVVDPLQKARISVYNVGNLSKIELIQPLCSESFTWSFLGKGGGLHHVCYEGLSISNVYDYLSKYKLLRVRGPMFAVAFDRQVLFAVNRHRFLFEFLL